MLLNLAEAPGAGCACRAVGVGPALQERPVAPGRPHGGGRAGPPRALRGRPPRLVRGPHRPGPQRPPPRAAPVHLRGIHEHFTRHLSPEVEVLTAALSRVVAAARAATEPTPTGAQAQVSDQAQLAGAGSAADHR